jgi:hypothetical protein
MVTSWPEAARAEARLVYVVPIPPFLFNPVISGVAMHILREPCGRRSLSVAFRERPGKCLSINDPPVYGAEMFFRPGFSARFLQADTHPLHQKLCIGKKTLEHLHPETPNMTQGFSV